jgi:hypothetical protein
MFYLCLYLYVKIIYNYYNNNETINTTNDDYNKIKKLKKKIRVRADEL